MRIKPKVVRYVSGVATSLLGSGGQCYTIEYIMLSLSSLSLKLEFSLCVVEFLAEEFKAANIDPIAQFSKPVSVMPS